MPVKTFVISLVHQDAIAYPSFHVSHVHPAVGVSNSLLVFGGLRGPSKPPAAARWF